MRGKRNRSRDKTGRYREFHDHYASSRSVRVE
jgi:hypothetical protein